MRQEARKRWKMKGTSERHMRKRREKLHKSENRNEKESKRNVGGLQQEHDY
jgi:hypothetical protein